MKKNYRKLCMAVVTGMLFASSYGTSFAASSEDISLDEPVAVEDSVNKDVQKNAKDPSEDTPSEFTDRIQRIIKEYDAKESTPKVTLRQPVAPPAPTYDYIDESAYEPRYNFDWQGTPLNATLYAIAKVSDKRIVVNGELEGKVYTSMTNVTYAQALDNLAKAFNFNYMLSDDGQTIIVSTSELMKQSKVFDIKYATKEKIKEELVSMGFDEANIYVNPENNTVSATGTPYQLSQAQRRIMSVDKPVKQCLIVAQLIEVSHGSKLNLGMQYTLPSYSKAAGDSLKGKFIDKLPFSVSAEANRALDGGHVIARPMMMTHNGQESSILMGDKVPVVTTTISEGATSLSIDYQNIGNNLKVTPVINEETGEIVLKLNLEVSNISRWVRQGNVQAPQISTRQADTLVTLKDGESFIIGGLMTKTELDNLSGIPGLMDLPILGELFKFHSREKSYSEIFIKITPYIVSDGINPQEILRAGK